jgi:hypothetical protein
MTNIMLLWQALATGSGPQSGKKEKVFTTKDRFGKQSMTLKFIVLDAMSKETLKTYFMKTFKNMSEKKVLVAYAYNPSYLEIRKIIVQCQP